MTTTSPTQSAPAPDAPVARQHGIRALLARSWALISVVLATLLWWPIGFMGSLGPARLPLALVNADLVATGAVAATVATFVVARPMWGKVAVSVLAPAVCWVLTHPTFDYPREGKLVAVALVAGVVVGALVGSALRGDIGVATGLALVSALTPWGRVTGPLLAMALAVPFVGFARRRLVPTALVVLSVLVVWVATRVLALALRYGWDTIRPGATPRDPAVALGRVREASVLLLRNSWHQAAWTYLRTSVTWYVVAAILAVGFAILSFVTRRGALAGAPELGPERSG